MALNLGVQEKVPSVEDVLRNVKIYISTVEDNVSSTGRGQRTGTGKSDEQDRQGDCSGWNRELVFGSDER